jgi:hypothetical protein
MDYPKMLTIRQIYEATRLDDVERKVAREIERVGLPGDLPDGAEIAVGVGSRWINNLIPIVRKTLAVLKEAGLKPFIVPAMGSHGGATAPGQRDLLKGLGISEETISAPVISSMEVVELGEMAKGWPVYLDKKAFSARGIVVINRVKPHTAFKGEIESGLMKMLTVGLGKHKGAEIMHRYGLNDAIPRAGRMIIEKAPVLLGIAILENSLDETMEVMAALPEQFEEIDRTLLARSKELIPKIPFDRIDILIIEQMGKDISGTGMDTNVIGMWRRLGQGEPRPDIGCLIVLDLTSASEGNAHGMGLADLTTKRLAEKIDYSKTYANALTAGYWGGARLPIVLESDREAINAALRRFDQKTVTIVRIKNTLDLEKLAISESLLAKIDEKRIEVIGKPQRLSLDSLGNLI